ncbi:hypothetical protein [Alienimonas chondri]|uniref:Tryptophan-rich sensory protein n=1 Tax=Alienimonas chondri TaxID=2681879 RepID=A0ABX1VEZ4_9PLAN|nr:hypothetical protein [Alienimonas chondri]NNJ26652.1 hypothetical protein [Alienimonas chondri]
MPPTDVLLPALACGALSVAQVLAAFWPQMRGWMTGRAVPTIAARSAEKPTPVVPAGAFFAVWGPIYLSCLAFAAWLNWGVFAGDIHAERITIAAGWPAAGLFAGNTVWALWVPQRGLDLGSVLIIAAEVACGVWALTALRSLEPLSDLPLWLGAVPLRFLAGWATAAAWVNLSSWLAGRPGEEIRRPVLLNPRSTVGAIAALLCLIASVAAAAWWGQSLATALAGAWALLGVAWKNLSPDNSEPSVPDV